MEIKINSKKHIILNELSVQKLLDQEMPKKQNGIAIAVNRQIVPKSQWKTHFIKDNDDILIITATQGG